MQATLARFGRIDILVQNAGIYPFTLLHDIPVTNGIAVLGGQSHAAASWPFRPASRPMRAQRYGRIVLTSSITGPRVSVPATATTAASKAGINGLIRAAALELAPLGITVNGVEPGNILTEAIAGGAQPEFIGAMERSVPLGRLGTPRDVALRGPVPRLRRGRLHHRHDASSSTAARSCPRARSEGMAPSQRERRPWDVPPLYFALAIVLMVALRLLLPIAPLIPWPWSLAGIVAIVAGIGLAIVAERRFRRAGTAGRPFEPSTALVEDGPFRFSRNPMYVGILLVLAGLFVLLGTLSPLLVIPAFFGLIRTRFVVPEEAHMERHFGERYLDYKRRVRRWL